MAARSAERNSTSISTATTMIPYLTGEVKESPRNGIIYFSDDGEVMAVRIGDCKFSAGRAARNFDEPSGRSRS